MTQYYQEIYQIYAQGRVYVKRFYMRIYYHRELHIFKSEITSGHIEETKQLLVTVPVLLNTDTERIFNISKSRNQRPQIKIFGQRDRELVFP